MKYFIGKSSKRDGKEAVTEAIKTFKNPKLILFFTGVEMFETCTQSIKEAFPNSMTIGATTFATFCKDGAYKESLMVMGIEAGIECYGDIIEEVDQYPVKYVECIKKSMACLKSYENTICFEVSTALIRSEELILSTLTSVIQEKNIPLVGGSAGDKGIAEKTMISFNGKIYDKACAFVFIRNLGGKIHLYQENIYKPTNHYFTATKVDVRKRIVYEYDYKPAATVVAKALGVDKTKLPSYLDSHPMGRVVGNEMYIVANQMVTEQNGMAYHARVYKNNRMILLEPDDYKKVVKKTINQIQKDVPKPSLAIMIHCLARSILFETDGYLNTFAKEMGVPLGDYIGFGGYGEQLNEQHFNQTMVIAVFE